MNKRILVVSNIYPDVFNSTAGTFVKNISCLLEKNGWEIEVCALSNETGRFNKIKNYLKFYFLSFARALRTADSIIHVHYVSHSMLGVLAAKFLKPNIKIVLNVHGSDVLQEENVSRCKFILKRLIVKVSLAKSEFTIVPSEYYKDLIEREYTIDKKKIRVSPSGGIELNNFKPTDRSSSEPLVLGYVGRLTRDKGFIHFLNLVDKLRESNYPVKVLIVGNGPLNKLANDYALSHAYVSYTPAVEHHQLSTVYNQMDLFIFPTLRITESLGLVGIEALACGVPVVAYDGSGPESYIDDGVNGFLASKNVEEQLFENVMRFINLSAESKSVMRCNAIAVARKYDSNIVGEQLNSIMLSTLNY